MATRQVDESAGRLILTNATPYVWKRSLKKPKGMKLWTFPETVDPGASVVVLVAFAGGDRAHGQASYQVRGSHSAAAVYGLGADFVTHDSSHARLLLLCC